MEPDNSYVDEWGTRWKKPESSLYFDPVDWPLKEAAVEDLDRYPWPDPKDPGRTEGLRQEARRLRDETDCAIVADMPVLGIFETASVCLRGIEQFMVDLLLDKPFAKALLNKLADIHVEFMRQYLEAVGDCIDVVMVSDDLGSENAPLISPDLYREMIKPVQRRLWTFIKEHTDAYLFMHTCGSVYRLIPDLIELGVDALNPIQVAARDMDTRRLKEEFGDKLTFWGAVDTQHVLPFGSARDVEEEVRKRITDLAPGGGFVLTAVHNIQPGVPPDNICMMYDAARQYGRYPIGK
jgi:uroporphyrinogen decarboxylase